MTYVHNVWCSTTKVIFSFNANNTGALTVKCKSPCFSKFKHIIITNVNIPPNISHFHVTSFFDTLITSASHILSNSLYIVGGDLNRVSPHSLSLLGLQNNVTYNTRLHSKLDHLFANCKDIFKARKHAPLSTSDHNTVRLLTHVRCKPTHFFFHSFIATMPYCDNLYPGEIHLVL